MKRSGTHRLQYEYYGGLHYVSPTLQMKEIMKHTADLRSYIAPGAPATRHPCDGRESALRVEFGFTPKWYQQHLDIDFSEHWHEAPVYRGETVTAMRLELRKRFPDIPIAGDFENMSPVNLDGVYGGLLVAKIFGIPVEYYKDNWPATTHAYLSEEVIDKMSCPVLNESPVIDALMKQMDEIEKEAGKIHGYLNWQGVLNNAYRIRGPEILTDLIVNPGLARHLFEVIAETMIQGMRLVYARQAATGVQINHATVSNCLVNMVSPEQYQEFLLPYDRRISEAFPRFGVHNCAWNVDPYIESYATLTPLDYVDMGLHSNFSKARELFPDTRRAVMYTPMDLLNKSPETLRSDLTRIFQELGPCDIVMADIEAGTPDERVQEFWAMAQEISRS